MIVTYYKPAIKALERIDAATRQRIRQAIHAIPQGDIKRLRGHTELYRLRVGDWRILFSYLDNDTILVEKLSPGGDVCKEV